MNDLLKFSWLELAICCHFGSWREPSKQRPQLFDGRAHERPVSRPRYHPHLPDARMIFQLYQCISRYDGCAV